MQLEYESKNLVLEKIALYLPKKNMNALETTARIPWVGGNKKLAKFVHLFPVELTTVAKIIRQKKTLNFRC